MTAAHQIATCSPAPDTSPGMAAVPPAAAMPPFPGHLHSDRTGQALARVAGVSLHGGAATRDDADGSPPAVSSPPCDTIDAATDRATWLAERRNGIGASDVAAIIGLSPWTSRYSLWADKAELLPDNNKGSEAMEFGLRAEAMLAGYFTDRTGLYVAGEQMQCTHPEHGWMRCSLDGLAFDSPDAVSILDALAAVEFKTTSDGPDAWAEQVPLHYAAQATWTSIVTGFDTVMFGVLHLAFGRPTFRVYEFTPAADDKALLIREASSFWHDHVMTGVPPDTDGTDATTNALRAAFPGDDDLDAIEAQADLVTAHARIVANKERIKTCEQIIADAENQIRAALGDHTALTHGSDAKGKPIVLATWKPSTRTGFDSKALLSDHPEHATYKTTTTTRTLLVKATKGK